MIRRKLRLTCERAKMELSSGHQALIRVDKIVVDHPCYNDLDFEMEITRSQYEEAAQKVLRRLESPIEKVLQDADLETAEIDDIVIVGGSTRTPWVKKWLKEYFNVSRLFESLDADEGVAYGATL